MRVLIFCIDNQSVAKFIKYLFSMRLTQQAFALYLQYEIIRK